jgi:hypothetical protein
MFKRCAFLVACCSALPLTRPPLSAAQQAPAEYARISLLRPHDGQTAEFEAGYKRHLDWHRAAGDSWTWLGWSFVAGERVGWFLDATFAHTPEALGAAVAPAEDAADNARNVHPHAEVISHGVYRFLPHLSRGGPQPAPGPLLELTTVTVRPGREGEFERLAGRIAARAPDPAYGWYRLVSGGRQGTYLLLRPLASVAEAARSTPFLDGVAYEKDLARLADVAAGIQQEVLLFRPDLTYRPAAPR